MTTEEYDNNGKGWYFRFNDDNNMSYKWILSITWTEMGQLNTYCDTPQSNTDSNPICATYLIRLLSARLSQYIIIITK